MKNNINDFSSPIMDHLIQRKTIPNKLNANLFDKFINGGHSDNTSGNNHIPINRNNNFTLKNFNSFNSNYFQNPNNLEGKKLKVLIFVIYLY